MRTHQLFGMLLFVVMALVAFGLFGVGDIPDHPQPNQISSVPLNESTSPTISEYRVPTVEEQTSVFSLGIGLIIGLLALVYIGGIAYDEYATIRDYEKEGYE